MKRLVIFVFIALCSYVAKSQEDVVEAIRGRVDSIVLLIETQKDENKKIELLLSIYTASIDGHPILFFETYQKLYLISQQQKDIIIESGAWSFAGQGYRLAGDYVKALECHQKAVALAEKSGNLLLVALAQNQMAHIYKDRLENNKALGLYRAASLNIEESKDTTMKWWPLMNMGAVYLNMGELDSSLFYSTSAFEHFSGSSSQANLDYILANIGSVYSIKGEPVKARDYFTKALAIAERFQSPRYINISYVAMAEHFKRYHQTDSSVYYAKKAIGIVQNTIISNLALKPARLLVDTYQNINADSTLKYWKVYTAANDSLFNTRANQQLMMMSFEEDRRKQELENEKKDYREKIKTNLILSALGMAILVMLILYRNIQQRKKTNAILQKTLSNLESTQAQLIHAEKMASLGELTAGIAHEIQNPLNFVNNFSEINNELIEEIKSQNPIAIGSKLKTDELNQVLDDIFKNNEKIATHGKRADAIVKGMLQHSRNSNGQKELTDINALADEYLRLAYHGLRAKDKSFNATIKTEFDNSLSAINVVPQDIGRVVLNLLTNAFYAVNEKAKQNIPGYEPAVSVGTKQVNDKIELRVSDNGNGIPKHIIDKVFQPFFTTKPTGQGTGLGLSLSYDIIKAHGGELKVETNEGKGSEFIIKLSNQPVK